MADLNDAPDLQTITASGVTGTDLFYVWDTSASVAKTITFTEQRKLTLEVVESAPTNGDAASVTLNPTGSNNDIKITAAIAGTAGNSLTAAISYNSSSPIVSAAKVGNAITLTVGAWYRLAISVPSISSLSGTYIYSGETLAGHNWEKSGDSGSTLVGNSTLGYELSNNDGTAYGAAGNVASTSWINGASETITVIVSPQGCLASEMISVANAALAETFENGSGSNGSGSIPASVTTTSLTGGTDASASNTPFLVNGSTLYVNVGTVAAPEWKEKELDNLS
jgi:hypothetical protein